MAEQTPQIAGEQDRVFNAETCRALRRMLCSRGGVWYIFCVVGVSSIAVIESLFSTSSLMKWLAGVYAVAMVLVGLWAILPTLREMKPEVVWVFAHRFNLEHKLPADFEYHPPTNTEENEAEQSAVPALIAGRAPADWLFIVGPPLVVLGFIADGVSLLSTGVALGGCIVYMVIMFRITRGSFVRPTYPPENPPHER